MNNNTTNDGIGFFGLLAIVFITLKLLGTIDWPWIWVLAPIWGPFIFAFSMFALIMLVCIISMSRK